MNDLSYRDVRDAGDGTGSSASLVGDWPPSDRDDDPSGRLLSFARRIAEPRERIEDVFLGIGASLGEGAAVLRRLTIDLEALSRKLEEPEVVDAIGRLEGMVRDTRSAIARFQDEGRHLDRLADWVGTVDRAVKRLNTTVRAISAVAVNAHIAASHLSGDRQDFSAFTTDIVSLAKHAGDVVGEFSSRYGVMVGALKAAMAHRQQFDKDYLATLGRLADRLEEGLTLLARQRRETAVIGGEVGPLAGRVAEGVGNAVSALQIGDITRQRTEHVEEVLIALAQTLVQDDDIAPDELTMLLGMVCALQAKQLEGASGDFDQRIRSLHGALLDLVTEAGDVVDKGGEIRSGRDQHAPSPVERVTEDLRRALEILRACENARAEFEHISTTVMKQVSDLLGFVRTIEEIKADMHLVSLNMTLRCGRLGSEGNAFQVIARELRHLTAETVTHSKKTIDGLTEASAIEKDLEHGGDGAGVAGLEKGVGQALEVLESVGGETNRVIGNLARDGVTVTELLRDAARIVDAQGEVATRLASVATDMAALGAPFLGEDGNGASDQKSVLERAGALLEGRHYTMESERLLHEAIFGRNAVPSEDVVSHPPADEDEDGLDDILF